jgi:hypothetical protein
VLEGPVEVGVGLLLLGELLLHVDDRLLGGLELEAQDHLLHAIVSEQRRCSVLFFFLLLSSNIYSVCQTDTQRRAE